MTTMEERYDGPYLRGDQLPEGVLVPVTIERVSLPGTEKDRAKRLITEAILWFAGKEKGLILNPTNYKNLSVIFGTRNPAEWIGKKINLQRRYLEKAFATRNVICIRVVMPPGAPILHSAAVHMGSATPYAEK